MCRLSMRRKLRAHVWRKSVTPQRLHWIAIAAVVWHYWIALKTRWRILSLCHVTDYRNVLIVTFIAPWWEISFWLLAIFGSSVFKPNLKCMKEKIALTYVVAINKSQWSFTIIAVLELPWKNVHDFPTSEERPCVQSWSKVLGYFRAFPFRPSVRCWFQGPFTSRIIPSFFNIVNWSWNVRLHFVGYKTN